MVERATDRWPVDRASDSNAAGSAPEQWGGDQADRIAARIGEGRTLLAWVAPSEGDAARVKSALLRSLAGGWRVVELSVALLTPEELAMELVAAFGRSGGEASETPTARRRGVVLLLEGGDGLLPATADWLAAVHDRASSAGHSIVLMGRSNALIARIVERRLPGCELIEAAPTGSSVEAPTDLVPEPIPAMGGEDVSTSAEPLPPKDEDRYWIVLPEVPEATATVLAFPSGPPAPVPTRPKTRIPTSERPHPEATRGPTPASRLAAEADAGSPAIATVFGEEAALEPDSAVVTPARGRLQAWSISLMAVVLSVAFVMLRAFWPSEEPTAPLGPRGSSDARPTRPRVEALAPETAWRVQAENPTADDRMTEATATAVGDRHLVLFDAATGQLSFHLSRTPLYEVLMLIGWQTGIRFETDLALAEPVDLVAEDLPVRDALRRLLDGYQFIELFSEPADTPIPRTVWVMAPQPGPPPVDRALEALATSPDEAVRNEAVRELAALGRSAAGIELLSRVERAVSVDAEEAGFVAGLRGRIEASLCREGNGASVGPQATTLSCDY